MTRADEQARKFTILCRGVKADERGRRYADVSSDAALAGGVSVLVPLVVARNGEPKSVASNVSDATASAATPTQNDLRDLLSEADAILLDSSMAASSRMKASSSSSVAGSYSSSNPCASKSGLGGSACIPNDGSVMESAAPVFKNALTRSLPFASLAIALLSLAIATTGF